MTPPIGNVYPSHKRPRLQISNSSLQLLLSPFACIPSSVAGLSGGQPARPQPRHVEQGTHASCRRQWLSRTDH
eukprot:1509593-Amphidinium_carterae.1